MKTFYDLIGEGSEELTSLQTAIRGLLIFIIALVVIRFAGRRSFGMRSPFDNVISILLGAILSRSVLGADFFPPIAAAVVIAAFHRLFAWISMYSDWFGSLIKGNPRIIYKDGKVIQKNIRASFISDKDFHEGLRKENVDSPEKIKSAYVERDGSISVVKE